MVMLKQSPVPLEAVPAILIQEAVNANIHNPRQWVIVQIDVANAFNTLS